MSEEPETGFGPDRPDGLDEPDARPGEPRA